MTDADDALAPDTAPAPDDEPSTDDVVIDPADDGTADPDADLAVGTDGKLADPVSGELYVPGDHRDDVTVTGDEMADLVEPSAPTVAGEPTDSEVAGFDGEGNAVNEKGEFVSQMGTAVDGVVVEDSGVPLPVTPSSSTDQQNARVLYENEVNARIETWLVDARGQITEAFIAGKNVEITVTDPDE